MLDKYEAYAKIAISMYEAHKDNPEILNMSIGLIAESLHRTPRIHSGLISVACADRAPDETLCKEHYFGRQASAIKIFEQIAKGKSFARIVAIFKSRSRVHYTTGAENQELKKYNKKNPGANHHQAYKECNIVLQKYVKKNQKYVYKIEGVIYNNIGEILKKYNIDRATLGSRCNAKKKWPDWEKILMENT